MLFLVLVFAANATEESLKICKLKHFWFAVYGSSTVFALHLYLHILYYFYMEVFLLFLYCLIVSPPPSPKNWLFFFPLVTLDKSISGLTDLISPMFTRRSYLLLTVGVLTFISREMARKDFLPSSINDFRIATSVLSRSTGNAATIYSMLT